MNRRSFMSSCLALAPEESKNKKMSLWEYKPTSTFQLFTLDFNPNQLSRGDKWKKIGVVDFPDK